MKKNVLYLSGILNKSSYSQFFFFFFFFSSPSLHPISWHGLRLGVIFWFLLVNYMYLFSWNSGSQMKIILLSRHFKSVLKCTGAPAYKTVCFPSKYSLKIFGNCDYQLTKFDEYKLKNYYFGLRCLLLLTPFIFKSDAKCFLPCYFKIASLWLAD